MPELHPHDLIELTIIRLGGLGDGIGVCDGQSVFVPLTVVGELVRAEVVAVRKGEVRARLVEVLAPGQGRQDPPCAHFGVCGGCSLQHLAEGEYNAFKAEMVAQIVRRLGAPPETVRPMVSVGAGARRRVEVKVAVHKGVVQLGFFGMRSHALVDIAQCPVTDGGIVALFPSLREVIASLKKPGQVKAVHIAKVDGGFDIMISTSTRMTAGDREKLAEYAARASILRIMECDAEGNAPVPLVRGDVRTRFGDVAVELPPAAFLQATEAGQEAITAFILEHVRGCDRVMDLYSGCGTYSFPMQQQGHQVTAYEGSHDMVAAMHNAIRASGLEGRMRVTARDLFAQPLTAAELKSMDAVVINPPRNGAETQVKELARSGVRSIVMVSCNPATFERNAQHLLHKGYRLTAAMPIDQFYWSAHMELVAAFERQ